MKVIGSRTLPGLVIAAALTAPGAWGHGSKAHDSTASGKAATVEEKPYGRPGEAQNVTRTIEVDMSDAMRFTPASIEVREGDTVQFVVRNSGGVLHEMVIGTSTDLEAHAALMRKFPGMEHDEPNMTPVAPGKAGEIVWQFTQVGDYRFACLLPGHFEAGMIGTIRVVDGPNPSAGK